MESQFPVILYDYGVEFGSFLTHHCLVVDLDHLVPCVDLLTLVCWRLQGQKLEEKKKRQREQIQDISRRGFVVSVEFETINRGWQSVKLPTE